MSDQQSLAFQKVTLGFLICRITKAGRRYYYTGVNDKGQTERWVLWKSADDFVMKIFDDRPQALAESRLLRKHLNGGDRMVIAQIEADPISVIAHPTKIKA